MDNARIQKYTVGFVFSRDRTKVLLVHKQRPEWQKGKLNGVGGKYEPGETPERCIKRETEEETRLVIDERTWVYVGTIEQDEGDVGVLAACYSGSMSDATANDHEEIEWFDIEALPENVIRNVRWLVPLSLEKLECSFERFSVRYHGSNAKQ